VILITLLLDVWMSGIKMGCWCDVDCNSVRGMWMMRSESCGVAQCLCCTVGQRYI